ncbi:unnamed protein product [Parnassius apollo]|uniref:(apollo) hypothetical protein n=1 Tax=Parnassius apollo TaxID=110799 RepID=A0A8S3XYV1_PARAO|nr:unnamed protein product [Parnassius apollo]
MQPKINGIIFQRNTKSSGATYRRYTNRERYELPTNIPVNIDDANVAAERLQEEITDSKLLLISEISELKQEVSRISLGIRSPSSVVSSSAFPSVQASLEELRREMKELKDTAVDSTSPIRLAIEGLRSDLKHKSQVEERERVKKKKWHRINSGNRTH